MEIFTAVIGVVEKRKRIQHSRIQVSKLGPRRCVEMQGSCRRRVAEIRLEGVE